MDAPRIRTAIPKRRYQLGSFTCVVLGEIESNDNIDYRYILAMVEQGSQQPSFYVTAERNTGGKGGTFRLRIVAPWGEELIGSSDESSLKPVL